MISPGTFRKILNFMSQFLKILYLVTILELTYKQAEANFNTVYSITVACIEKNLNYTLANILYRVNLN